MIRNRKQLEGDSLFSSKRADVLNIVEAGLKACRVPEIFDTSVRLSHNTLYVAERKLKINNYENILVIGFGKASGLMAVELENILGDRITRGVVIAKEKCQTNIVEVIVGSHPEPSSVNIEAAKKIVRLLKDSSEKDLVICLTSGGGSALLTLPAEGIPLDDLKKTNKILLASGAPIEEINSVRKHVSQVKGGRLAGHCKADVVNIVVSDVVGDRLDVIASGPLTPDESTFREAVDSLKKHKAWRETPNSVRDHLMKGIQGKIRETPKEPEEGKNIAAIIVGKNWTALKAAKEKAVELGFNTLVVSSLTSGDAGELARKHSNLIKEVYESGTLKKRPVCLLSGGESTVKVTGTGLGGRNQEFIMSLAKEIAGQNIVGAAVDTDGIECYTDAAGAIADGDTIARAKKRGIDYEKLHQNNDTYSFFEKLGDLIITGETGTNVNDLRVVACFR